MVGKCNDWDDFSSTWQQFSAEELDDQEEERGLETILAGESEWILDFVILDSDVEEESKCLQEPSEARTLVLACDCDPCP